MALTDERTTLPSPHSPLSSSSSSSAALTVDHPHPGSEDRVEKELVLELAHTLTSHEKPACVKFSQDGKYIAVGCSGGEAHIFEVQSGTLTRILRNLLSHDEGYIGAVSFSPDGKYLAAGSWNGDINIWEINTKHVRNTFQGHTHTLLSLKFSPNGRLLASSSGDNTVRLWDMHDGSATFLTEEYPTFLDSPCYTSTVFSPDGKLVASSHRDGIVRIWCVRTGRLVRRVQAHMESVSEIAFMPDGKGLVSASADHTLRYWDISSLNTAHNHHSQAMNDSHRDPDTGVEDQTQFEQEFVGHGGHVHSVAISPDGRWISSGSVDKTVRIWDSRNAEVQRVLDFDDEVSTVDFSPAGRYLASGVGDGAVKIWRYTYANTSSEMLK